MSIAESTWREIWEQQMINIEQSIGRAHRVRPDMRFVDYTDVLIPITELRGITPDQLSERWGFYEPMNDQDAYLDRIGVVNER